MYGDVLSLQAEREQKKALIWRPLDLLLVIYLLGAMGFTLLRGLVSGNTTPFSVVLYD